MRVVLLGRKQVACDALYLMLERGIDVTAVVVDGSQSADVYAEQLGSAAAAANVPVIKDPEIYLELQRSAGSEDSSSFANVDYVLSILHLRRIRPELISLAGKGCINFHPAPLPDYRGWGVFQLAILENVEFWGATAHYVEETIDTGPIICSKIFQVNSPKETSWSLQLKTQSTMLDLIVDVVDRLLCGTPPAAQAQGPGRYISKKEILGRRFISPEDSPTMIDRKIRAFWYPPNPPAEIEFGGTRYVLMPQESYDDIARALSVSRVVRDEKNPTITAAALGR